MTNIFYAFILLFICFQYFSLIFRIYSRTTALRAQEEEYENMKKLLILKKIQEEITQSDCILNSLETDENEICLTYVSFARS